MFRCTGRVRPASPSLFVLCVRLTDFAAGPLYCVDHVVCSIAAAGIPEEVDVIGAMGTGISIFDVVIAGEMFSCLKRAGCPARLCLFRGENHELSRSGRPDNRITRLEEILSWFIRYLHP